VLTGLITNLLMYVVPIYNMNVFDKVLPNGLLGILSSLVLMAVFLVLIWFVNRSALSYLLSDRIYQLEIQLSDEFSRRLCNLKPSAMPDSASFMTQLVTYGRSLSQMIGMLHLMALVDLPFLLISLVLIGYFGGPLVIIPLVAMALVIGINLVLQPRIRKFIQARYEFEGRKRKFEYEIMQSLPFIKMAGMERYFTDTMEHHRPDHRQYFSISAHINHISMLILFLSLISVTGYGAWRVAEGMMTMGQLVACSLLAAKAISNASITNLLFNINRIKTLFDNLNRFYQIPVEERGAAFCLTRIKHLALKEVTFNYPENRYFHLKGINIDLNLPDSLYIYGKPGAGKSSLFSLLAGLAEPAGGQMLVNHLNIEHFDYRDVRRHIHFSSSYYRFFTGTLYDNLTMGRTSVTADQVAEALEKVQLTEKINQIEDGLHFWVENMDIIPLSSGERKRFMLARAFLSDADLLVLDEPFEFLSDESSLSFIQAIGSFCQETGKGLVILSNRKAFAHLCDDALTLNNGQLYPMKTQRGEK
ncbi:MAG: ATP-binding cassette domain-containing protein, partial [Endozoicomonas sp.]